METYRHDFFHTNLDIDYVSVFIHNNHSMMNRSQWKLQGQHYNINNKVIKTHQPKHTSLYFKCAKIQYILKQYSTTESYVMQILFYTLENIIFFITEPGQNCS